MRSEPPCIDWMSLDFARILPRRDESFTYEHTQMGQPGKVR